MMNLYFFAVTYIHCNYLYMSVVTMCYMTIKLEYGLTCKRCCMSLNYYDLCVKVLNMYKLFQIMLP